MALSPLMAELVDLKLARYCEGKTRSVRSNVLKVSYAVKGNEVTIYEGRPHFLDRTLWAIRPVAKMKYNEVRGTWTLYCPDRDVKWHKYRDLGPAKKIGTILQEIDDDPTGIFWFIRDFRGRLPGS
jgi:hypothetical protein